MSEVPFPLSPSMLPVRYILHPIFPRSCAAFLDIGLRYLQVSVCVSLWIFPFASPSTIFQRRVRVSPLLVLHMRLFVCARFPLSPDIQEELIARVQFFRMSELLHIDCKVFVVCCGHCVDFLYRAVSQALYSPPPQISLSLYSSSMFAIDSFVSMRFSRRILSR